jgi:TnpA family transposase
LGLQPQYDSIHRNLYLLNYIDSSSLRQNVQKAVNRGEHSHQLRRSVSFASFGKLRFRTEYEQYLWSECSCLIANCIIFYNASILSRLLERKGKRGADASDRRDQKDPHRLLGSTSTSTAATNSKSGRISSTRTLSFKD